MSMQTPWSIFDRIRDEHDRADMVMVIPANGEPAVIHHPTEARPDPPAERRWHIAYYNHAQTATVDE